MRDLTCPRGFQSHVICGCEPLKLTMRDILDKQARDPARQLHRPVPHPKETP